MYMIKHELGDYVVADKGSFKILGYTDNYRQATLFASQEEYDMFVHERAKRCQPYLDTTSGELKIQGSMEGHKLVTYWDIN